MPLFVSCAVPYTWSVFRRGRKPSRKEKRRDRERLFSMMLDLRDDDFLCGDLVFDEERQLFRTRDGRPVLSRHFVDTDLLFGKENQVSPGYY